MWGHLALEQAQRPELAIDTVPGLQGDEREGKEGLRRLASENANPGGTKLAKSAVGL